MQSLWWPVNKQDGLRAEWVQEQKNIAFDKLIGKLSVIVDITKETNMHSLSNSIKSLRKSIKKLNEII